MAMLSSRALQAQGPLPGEAAAHDPMDTEADCWQDSLETQADASEAGTTIPASLPSPFSSSVAIYSHAYAFDRPCQLSAVVLSASGAPCGARHRVRAPRSAGDWRGGAP